MTECLTCKVDKKKVYDLFHKMDLTGLMKHLQLEHEEWFHSFKGKEHTDRCHCEDKKETD